MDKIIQTVLEKQKGSGEALNIRKHQRTLIFIKKMFSKCSPDVEQSDPKSKEQRQIGPQVINTPKLLGWKP